MSCSSYRMGQITYPSFPIFLTLSSRLRNWSGPWVPSKRSWTTFARSTTSSHRCRCHRTSRTHRYLTSSRKTQLERYRYRTWRWCTHSTSVATRCTIPVSNRLTKKTWRKSSSASTCQRSIAPRICAARATTKWATRRSRPNVRTRTNQTMLRACARTVT